LPLYHRKTRNQLSPSTGTEVRIVILKTGKREEPYGSESSSLCMIHSGNSRSWCRITRILITRM